MKIDLRLMNTIKFEVQGSLPDPYIVTFVLNEKNLNAFCTCAAGEKGQVCKHRLNILMGVTDCIVSDNSHQVSEVCKWSQGTDVEHALSKVIDAENELKLVQEKVKLAKKNLGIAMRK